MNIFNSLKVYAEKWNVTSSRSFTQEEIDSIDDAEVVDSQYGFCVCCHLRNGGQTYIPLSNTSSLGIGDSVDLTKAKLLTLSRTGEADILRIEA